MTPITFTISEGKVGYIQLPEEPNPSLRLPIKGTSTELEDEIRLTEYQSKIEYARLHPIPVHPEDQDKAKKLMFVNHRDKTDEKIVFDTFGNWLPPKGKEYSVTGVSVEIDEIHICEACNKQGLRNCGYFDECGGWITKQVCRIIDGVKGKVTKELRSVRVDLFSPCEKAIYDAQMELEKVGVDILLTKAGLLLSEARQLVTNYLYEKENN